MDKRVYLSPPHMNGREIEYIHQAFESNWIAPLGENIDAFEAAVKSYTGIAGAVAVSSGTAALHLALRYAGVGAGDVVLCSDVTFAASCNPITYQQAEPVFIDSDKESWCMNPSLLADALHACKREGRLPKAVVVVDLYGMPADYNRITDICAEFGVTLIEDAAEALGASYKGRRCGTFGALNILSFNANKIITTSSGGMVLSDDEHAIQKMKFWATQAREVAPHYEHKEIGYNYRMSNICAGIGRGQMETLDSYVQIRRGIFNRYQQGLSDLPVSFNPMLEGAQPNFWLTVLVLEGGCGVSAAQLADALAQENIETRPYWKPMHMQPVYQGCRFFHSSGKQPVGQRLFESAICLPSGSALTADTQDKIMDIIRGCFANSSCMAAFKEACV